MITPWEVSGEIDYKKVVEEFGAKLIDDSLFNELGEDIPPMLKRRLYFSHRDFDDFIKNMKEGKKVAILTGRGPSGPVHIGHLIPFMVAKWFQDKYGVDVIIPISDDEKFLVKEKLSYEQAKKYAEENAKDILSLGFDKKKTKILIDLKNTEIYRFAVRVAKRITYNTAKAVYGINDSMNIGWVFYPAVNAAHILLPSLLGYDATLVPIGIDQDPHVKIARDVAPKLNLKKPAAIHSKFIPSLTGESKMSTTTGNTIWLSDDEETVKEKIMKYALTGGRETLKMQKELGGQPDKCVVFAWLKYVFEEDDNKLKEIHDSCISGKRMCGECKEYLANKIYGLLHNLQKRRDKVDLEDYKFDLVIP